MTDFLMRDSAGPGGLVPSALEGVLGNTSGESAAPAFSRAQFRGGLSPRVLQRVREHVETKLEGTISLHELAATAGLSASHFARAFKQSEGTSPHRYVVNRRLQQALQLLAGTKLPLSEIANATGFADQSHFSRQFRKHIGVTPSSYRWSTR
jgi:AraC family transcriptional regulator